MAPIIRGICETCRKRVPATHAVRDGKVYLSKDCPDCGTTEALVSNDAATWERKREIWRYDSSCVGECSIECETCGHQHQHKMVFMDVTNRCNMNCPICINNTPSMGFLFEPPLSYFEKVISGLARMDPPPTIQLFGGEPTVRKDLFEIIELCRKYDMRVRIVTNGLKLADEEFCKRICEANVPVLLAFDGCSPEIYERLRKNPGAYEKKMKALDNLQKYSRRKSTIMVCVARKINDKHMGELIEFVHERRNFIDALHLIPLTETWEEGEFETDIQTTAEDVEKIIDEAIADERVEFVPAGIAHQFRSLLPFFGSPRLTFGGVHPNCESLTLLFSEGERYHTMSYYMKRPLDEFMREAVARTDRISARLGRLDPARPWQLWRGRLLALRTLGGLVIRSFRLGRLLKGNTFVTLLRLVGGLLVGRKARHVLKKHVTVQSLLLMIVLPFEEYHSIDSARLHTCVAGMAFEDPDTGEVKTIPVCSWSMYKNDIQRRIAEKYAAGTVSV